MSAITRTLNKLFGHSGPAIEVRADAIDQVRPVKRMSRARQREAMLVQLQQGYGEVVETLKSLRDHMEEQSARSDRMLAMMGGLPDLLRSIPETNKRQTQTLEAIRTHLQHQSESTAQLSGALTDLAGVTTEQHKAMDELHQQLAANRASGEALRDSLGILAESMEHVTDSSKANVDAVNRIAEQSARNERHTGTLFRRSQRHATAMSAVSWALALVALAVSAYVAVMITNLQPNRISTPGAAQAGLAPSMLDPLNETPVQPVVEQPAADAAAPDGAATAETAAAPAVKVDSAAAGGSVDPGPVLFERFISPQPGEMAAPVAEGGAIDAMIAEVLESPLVDQTLIDSPIGEGAADAPVVE